MLSPTTLLLTSDVTGGGVVQFARLGMSHEGIGFIAPRFEDLI